MPTTPSCWPAWAPPRGHVVVWATPHGRRAHTDLLCAGGTPQRATVACAELPWLLCARCGPQARTVFTQAARLRHGDERVRLLAVDPAWAAATSVRRDACVRRWAGTVVTLLNGGIDPVALDGRTAPVIVAAESVAVQVHGRAHRNPARLLGTFEGATPDQLREVAATGSALLASGWKSAPKAVEAAAALVGGPQHGWRQRW